MSEISFGSAGVNNQTGIDITQGMIDDVANPFLDLNAIVTQFQFNESGSVTVTIPAGTTVKYGDEQCTLLEDVTATLTPSKLTGDSHATTTSGTVLSGTTLSNGQLITTSCEWTVALGKNVKVRTQDGYVILGSKDPNSLSAGCEVTLSEGTNVLIKTEENDATKKYKTVSVSIVNNSSMQFYFLADVSYHQIVLQELYDTLESMEDIILKEKVLAYLFKNCIGTGRNNLSSDEYNALKNMSWPEIKKYLSSLTWYSNGDELYDKDTVSELVAFLKDQPDVTTSDIISIYEKYGVFSDKEIANLRNNKLLNGKTGRTWTVDGLLALAEINAFPDNEINTIRKSAAMKFLNSLKSVSGITVDDIKEALTVKNANGDIEHLCYVSSTSVDGVCDELRNHLFLSTNMPTDVFTLGEFDQFLENLVNIKLSELDICVPALSGWVDGTDCVELTDDAEAFFTELEEWCKSGEGEKVLYGGKTEYSSLGEYLTSKFGVEDFDELKEAVRLSKKNPSTKNTITIQSIYDTLYGDIEDTVSKDKNTTWYDDVTNPNGSDADSVKLTSDAEDYFTKLKKYTGDNNSLVTPNDLKNVCDKLSLKVDKNKTSDYYLEELKSAVLSSTTTPSDINDKLSNVLYSSWSSSESSIEIDNKIIKSIIGNTSITVDALKNAVYALADVSSVASYFDSITSERINEIKDLIRDADSKQTIMEILSDEEFSKIINIGNLVYALTKVSKYDTCLYKTELINEIKNTGKLSSDTLYEYEQIDTIFDSDSVSLASAQIIDKLRNVQRIDVEGLKSGILELPRFSDLDGLITDARNVTLEEEDALVKASQEYQDALSNLLNLCLLAGTPSSGQDNYTLASGVQRTLDSSGNYVYKIVSEGTKIETATLDASFSKKDAVAGMALPYFALAIMYEKTCIQQMILVEQLKQIEKINDEIEENNRALKVLTELYDKVYEAVTWSSNKDDLKSDNKYKNLTFTISLNGCEMSVEELDTYLKKIVDSEIGLGEYGTIRDFADVNANSYMIDKSKNGWSFITVIARYDRDGNNMWSEYTKWQKGEKGSNVDHNTSNIDVKEQATLTRISNLQDQVRMYGDTLSTDAQLMTTKMEQYMQDANSCVSACTQTVKSIGDYWKNIITNIR